jgi:hypothetical protein
VLSVTGGSVSFVDSNFSGMRTRSASHPVYLASSHSTTRPLCSTGNWAPNAVVLASETDVHFESCTFASNAGGAPAYDYGSGAVVVMEGNLVVSNSRQAQSLACISQTHRQAGSRVFKTKPDTLAWFASVASRRAALIPEECRSSYLACGIGHLVLI